jgi:hypothetical protein
MFKLQSLVKIFFMFQEMQIEKAKLEGIRYQQWEEPDT